MRLIADLHLHSKYSRAVSQQMVVPEIANWAAKKGIGLVASGDWTHPMWLRELKENLEEAGEGIFKPKFQNNSVHFILATEISCIYSQGGRGRRIHNVVFAPSFETVEKINMALRNRGINLFSDGRPITGLSAKELAKLVFDVDERCLIVPAHVWTPWFSLYGSQSGFDSMKECFGEISEKIMAIETGLSSDPAMNWRIPELDDKAIISSSDAHSLAKLGREATVFEVEGDSLDYEKFKDSIKNQKIAYTIEFYPEEGKYHWTGHRNCNVSQSPQQTKRLGEICPVCGKHLTIGVMHRVQQLAGREVKIQKSQRENGLTLISNGESKRPPYVMLVPLLEILVEALNSSSLSKSVLAEYDKLIYNFEGEFKVLLEVPIKEILKVSGERVAEGIKRVREGRIVVKPGFDGVFGVVKIWNNEKTLSENGEGQSQMSLF